MTFDISIITAIAESPFHMSAHCFCCNKELKSAMDGSIVSYDAYPNQGTHARVAMHRDCAFAMAQRIICDAWPNRRAGDVLMKNDK
jgi:hypothetical protein